MYPIFFLIFGWEKIRKIGDNILLSLGKKLVIQSRFQTFFFKKKQKGDPLCKEKLSTEMDLKGKKGAVLMHTHLLKKLKMQLKVSCVLRE